MKDLGWLQEQVSCRKYLLSRHANQRMEERGILIRDVLRAIVDGNVLERQSKSGDPKLLLEGYDLGGAPFYVVVALSEPLPTIVTVCQFHDDAWEEVDGLRQRRRL